MSDKMINDLETQVIHAGEPEERIRGAVAMPVFQSSTFEHVGDAGYHDVRYIRLNNTPNHEVLHRKLRRSKVERPLSWQQVGWPPSLPPC